MKEFVIATIFELWTLIILAFVLAGVARVRLCQVQCPKTKVVEGPPRLGRERGKLRMWQVFSSNVRLPKTFVHCGSGCN